MSGKTPLPAHATKHLSSLTYPFKSHQFHLAQLADGQSNGTALWLGAQCISLFLADLVQSKSGRLNALAVIGRRPRAVELGSGIGLTALALASMGWDVLATDIAHVTSAVLAPNIAHNASAGHGFGTIHVRELDWNIPPAAWTWDNTMHIATPSVAGGAEGIIQQDGAEGLCPPFDLIVTSDTLYSRALVEPLLRTLHHLSLTSSGGDAVSKMPNGGRGAPIYLALENRDPALVMSFLEQARNTWRFVVERVPQRKVAKAMERGGVDWQRHEWEGVEIWKLSLSKLTGRVEKTEK